MTDNEIKKALECCSEHDYLCPKGCPLDSEERDADCKALTKHALDLINRQQAEIERLKKRSILNGLKVVNKERKQIKSEAIKEFAERLKENFQHIPLVVFRIDNLVKEMTEEKEE